MHTHRLLATELEFQVHLWEESLVERGTRSLCRWSMRCDYFLIMSFDCLCMSWFICYVTVNLCSLLCALMYRMYTVRQKAFTLYFHINFAKLHSVLIIFGSCYCGYGQSDMYCISQGKVRTLAIERRATLTRFAANLSKFQHSKNYQNRTRWKHDSVGHKTKKEHIVLSKMMLHNNDLGQIEPLNDSPLIDDSSIKTFYGLKPLYTDSL